MWKWIKRVLGLVEHDRPNLPDDDSFHAENIDLIIAIAGHEEGGGMTTYNELAENDICREVVRAVDKLMPEKDVEVVARKFKSYRKYLKAVRKEIIRIQKKTGIPFNRILVVEFHLNDAGRKARGAEMLCRDTKSIAVLRPFITAWCKEFNIKPRRDKGIYHIEDGNGTGFLNVVKKLGCYGGIFEPFFAGFKTIESMQFLKDIRAGIAMIAEFSAFEFREILEA